MLGERRELGPSTREDGHELLAAPARVPRAEREEGGDDRARGRRGRVVRPARVLEQSGGPRGGIARVPLIARLATDPIAVAQRGHRLERASHIGHELKALIHRTGLTPRHRAPRRMP